MIDYVHEPLFRQDSVNKSFVFTALDGSCTITNSELSTESVDLSESLCSDTELQLGANEASSLSCEVHDINIELTGKWFDVDIYLNHDMDNPFRLGTYKVNSDKPTADKNVRQLLLFDAMYDIINRDVYAWYNSLTFPITLKNYRDSFFEYFDIEQEEVVLPSDILLVAKTIGDDSISGLRIIHDICECNGCFGHIGRDNVFHYVFLNEIVEGLYPADNLYPSDDLYPKEEIVDIIINDDDYSNVDYSNYRVKQISGVAVLNADGAIGATVGDTSNIYIVQNNSIAIGLNAASMSVLADNIYNVIANITYIPSEVECVGNPCIEVGDSVRFNTSDAIVFSYVLSRRMRGIQTLKDSLESQGTEYRSANLNSVQKSISKLQTQTNNLNTGLNTTNHNLGVTNSNLNGVSARVGSLEADHVSVGELNAVSARVGSLEADHVSVGSLNAVSARVGSIEANYLTVNNLTSKSVVVAQLGVIGTYINVGGATYRPKTITVGGEQITVLAQV